MPPARISLTLPPHFSLSFIASGRSSGLHSVSSQSCCMYVWAGHPAFARTYVGVHRSLSLLHQQCPACLVHLTWIVIMMGGRWLYSWCLVGSCCQSSVLNKSFIFFRFSNMTHGMLSHARMSWTEREKCQVSSELFLLLLKPWFSLFKIL